MYTRIRKLVDNWASCSGDTIYKIVDNAEYVSFDIFDTLLKRDVQEPQDIFYIVERKTGRKGFAIERINAEIKAREDSQKSEINIHDIYFYINGTEEEINTLMKMELECELEFSSVNYYFLKIFNYCVNCKKVILTSDMYLPREVILQLLEKNEITGFKRLYLSNEAGKTKLNGDLYEYILKDLNIDSQKIIHIGNSFRADYLAPRKIGIRSIKCSTYSNHMQRKYENVLGADSLYYNVLNSFINNHISDSNNEFYKFGYEVFGPLLFGFVKWLYTDAKKKKVEQILFLSRDGFVMKRLYDMLNLDIPSAYFEVSRRSLRIPNYDKHMSYEEIIDTLTVPNMSNIVQIFDSLGLDADKYKNEIIDYGFNRNELLKRDKLVSNEKFRKLYEFVKNDIFINASIERDNLIKYLTTFDFSKKTAIVDIGWGGSMQKYLQKALERFGISHDIQGYYVGLTLKSRENLGKNSYKAQAYAFDCLNRNDEELESAYIGLIETMFLEQDGSVKNYSLLDGKEVANRYPYEYLGKDGISKEALSVIEIQNGAMKFAEHYYKSGAHEFIGNDSKTMYCHMHAVGTNPSLLNIREFGDFKFFNCGNCVYLAKPHNLFWYFFKPSQLKHDIYDSQWKIGFLKALIKLDVRYSKIFSFLRKKANK